MTVGVDKVLDVIPAVLNFHLPDFLWCQLLYILCKSKNLYNFPAGIWYLEAWGRVVPTPGVYVRHISMDTNRLYANGTVENIKPVIHTMFTKGYIRHSVFGILCVTMQKRNLSRIVGIP